MGMFGKWIFRLFILFIFSSHSYAGTTLSTSQAYASISGGYGKFQHGYQGTGATTIGRIAIGSLWHLNENYLFGGEIGVQSGNRMELYNNVAGAFGYTSTPPVYLTVKPPVDILAALKLHLKSVFIQLKAGAVYLRTMTDSVDIPSESDVLAEAQAGAGFDLTCHTRVILSYQHFFGQNPALVNVNSAAGTAKIKHIPSWSAGMISFETDL